MKKSHEQSIIDAFSNYFRRRGESIGKKTYRLSVDGQDALVGADYIFTGTTNFTIVEFKYEEKDILAEGKKTLRERMCQYLNRDTARRNESLLCHYIAWSHLDKNSRTVSFNQYYPEVCNARIFPGGGLSVQAPQQDIRVNAADLVTQFLENKIGADYPTFRSYVDWLLSISDSRTNNIEVMMDNPEADELAILEFATLDLLNEWLIQNRPTLKKSFSPPRPF